ncbi:MAG: 2-oxo acid dehydrogenase subunit E2, partial [Actinobacteria bacterium]|nr:2-oxo acid dehydrogenase subunit E2 [Actinomycetota bacterium]
ETVKVGTPLAVVGEGAAGDGDSGGGEEAQPAAEGGQEAEKPATAESASHDTEEQMAAEGDRTEPEAVQAPPPETTPPPAPDKDEGTKEKEQQEEKQDEKQDEKASETEGAAARGAPGDQSKRGIISPLVRRLADEHDVELGEVEGTGTGGRIRKQDVLRFVEERKARPAARPAASAEPAPEPEEQPAPEREAEPAAAGAREELVPWSNIRRRTAEHMVASHLETARAWNAVEADWTNITELRIQAKEGFKAREGFGLTYMPFLAKAICETLLEMPEVNATYEEASQANRVKRYVNLGIAVALEGGGLIVPVVKGADEKNLVGLARAINDVATRARTKKLSPDDLTEGTFTITNPGPFGSIISVPIIPKGQTAILGFEAIQKRVVVTKDDAIAIRSMGFLSMSWDHRTIDGAEAAKFLAALRERIETTDFSAELSPYLQA